MAVKQKKYSLANLVDDKDGPRLHDSERELMDSLAVKYFYPNDHVRFSDLPYGVLGQVSGGNIHLNPIHAWRRLGKRGSYDPAVRFDEGAPRTLAHEVFHTLFRTSEQATDRGAKTLLDLTMGPDTSQSDLAQATRKALGNIRQSAIDEGRAARIAFPVHLKQQDATIDDVRSEVDPAKPVSTYVAR